MSATQARAENAQIVLSAMLAPDSTVYFVEKKRSATKAHLTVYAMAGGHMINITWEVADFAGYSRATSGPIALVEHGCDQAENIAMDLSRALFGDAYALRTATL